MKNILQFRSRQNNRWYTRGSKKDVEVDRSMRPRNKFSLKIMDFCCMSYQGVIKPFFGDPQKTKVTGSHYTKHVRKDLLSACQKLDVDVVFVFMQDGALSYWSNECQNFLTQQLGIRFIKTQNYCNHLDYYFVDALATKVYENQHEQFKKKRINNVWKGVAARSQVNRKANSAPGLALL